MIKEILEELVTNDFVIDGASDEKEVDKAVDTALAQIKSAMMECVPKEIGFAPVQGSYETIDGYNQAITETLIKIKELFNEQSL